MTSIREEKPDHLGLCSFFLFFLIFICVCVFGVCVCTHMCLLPAAEGVADVLPYESVFGGHS